MSILSNFEDRVGGALEGAFASVFRSPVQPSEIARALAKAMDDGRVLGIGKIYAPVAYTVALSPEDADIFGAFTDTLSGELSTYLVDHAREQHYSLSGRPAVGFMIHDDLKLGRFRVSADLAFAEDDPAAPLLTFDIAEDDEDDAPGPVGGIATVTVGETDHDVALRGNRVVVGRLATCDICLGDANASRSHAAFTRTADGWTIDDLESTNGTYLNGRRVTASERLSDGDVVEIGLTRLTFHSNGR
ncbi:MAG: DUF3662 and FHA domain-containing protein [Coriobacteriia bacterium]|nr:DUF3662 and FHA domain-containing protein [Coriobacteriia bacterium]